MMFSINFVPKQLENQIKTVDVLEIKLNISKSFN